MNDAERDQQLVTQLANDVVSRLWTLYQDSPNDQQPGTSLITDCENHMDGIRLALSVFGVDRPLYVYALPWSRGWSVFAEFRSNCGAYSWRDAPTKLAALSRALYAPRGKYGAHHVSALDIVNAIEYIITKLDKLDRARRARFFKKHWYWPHTLMQAYHAEHTAQGGFDVG